MGYKKQVAKVLFPLMANWDWSSKEEYKKDWKKFRSNMDKMWDQFQDLQKASKDNAKKQWEKVFPGSWKCSRPLLTPFPMRRFLCPECLPLLFLRKNSLKKRRNFRRRSTGMPLRRATVPLRVLCVSSSM